MIYGSLIAFVLSTITFILYEIRRPSPIMDLRLFRNWTFSSSIVASLLSFITMYSPTVLVPFFFQRILGFSTSQSGLYMMAFPIMMAVISPFSGALSDKIGAVVLTTSGLVINGAALVMLGTVSTDTPVLLVLVYLGVMGLALGLFQSPNNSCIMGCVPKDKLGGANGITQLVKNLGMVIGIAFSVALFSALSGTGAENVGPRFVESTRTVYFIAAGLSMIGAVISAVRGHDRILSRN